VDDVNADDVCDDVWMDPPLPPVSPLALIPSVFWYQGEADVTYATTYSRCFPAMIQQWRADFFNHTNGASDPDMPFVFVQISSWPVLDSGVVADLVGARGVLTGLPPA
jgi:hypothetical protein